MERETPPPRRESLERAAAEQLRAVATGPNSELLDEILRTHLARPLSADTYDDIGVGLAVIGFRMEAMSILTWLAGHPAGRIGAAIDDLNLAPEADRLIRRLLALYGPQLYDALMLNEFPQRDDWRSLEREIHRNIESGEYVVTLCLEKINREAIRIRADPGSLLRLTRQLLLASTELEDSAALPPPDVARLREAWGEFEAFAGADARAPEGPHN